MSSPDPESRRLAVGDQPVNRRTAPRRRTEPVNPQAAATLQQRQEQLRARHDLGRPLTQGAPRTATLVVPASAWVLGVLGFMVIGAAFFSGWAGPYLGALGLAGLAGSGVLTQRATRNVKPDATQALPELQALDALLLKAAPKLPPAAAEILQAIKVSLERAQQPGAMASLSTDERYFVRECASRYLPDTLEAYLQVPAPRRSEPLAAGEPSANEAVEQQLQHLLEGLHQRLATLDDVASKDLLLQHRFLELKSQETRGTL